MTYSIRWSRRATNELADVWLNNPADRDQIVQATATADHVLAENPEDEGESRDEGKRVMFLSPLVIYYSVDSARQIVRVLEIRGTRRTKG